jgi:hypothetical protein
VHYWMPHEGSNRVAFGLIWTSPEKVEGFSDRISESGEQIWVRIRRTRGA